MSAKTTKKKLGCEMVFCEDPETGRLLVKPKGKCPEGYLERFTQRVNKEGFLVVKPTAELVEEDELQRIKPKVTTIEEQPDEDTATAAAK